MARIREGDTTMTTSGQREIIQIISTKRSGHHAFLNWYAKGRAEPVAFFNDIVPSKRPWVNDRVAYFNDHPPIAGKNGLQKLINAPHVVLVNQEGRRPDNVRALTEDFLKKKLQARVVRHTFLRDPLNFLASSVKRWNTREPYQSFKPFLQALAFEEIVMGLQSDDFIAFSGWRFDEAYREELAQRLGIENTTPEQKVTLYGGGSSFSGKRYVVSGADERSDLIGRWEKMRDDPGFLAMFRDDRFVDACRRYFDKAGDRELTPRCSLDDVLSAAARSADAERIARKMIAPLRRVPGLLSLHDGTPIQFFRNTCHVLLQTWAGVAVKKRRQHPRISVLETSA